MAEGGEFGYDDTYLDHQIDNDDDYGDDYDQEHLNRTQHFHPSAASTPYGEQAA